MRTTATASVLPQVAQAVLDALGGALVWLVAYHLHILSGEWMLVPPRTALAFAVFVVLVWMASRLAMGMYRGSASGATLSPAQWLFRHVCSVAVTGAVSLGVIPLLAHYFYYWPPPLSMLLLALAGLLLVAPLVRKVASLAQG
jgi:hypothetical protein